MLVFKLLSQIVTALVAFAVGTGIVSGAQYLTGNMFAPAPAQVSNVGASKSSGIYFVTPSVDQTAAACNASDAELYPFGWDSYLQTHQIPEMKRTARDGRWFFFETKTDSGNSYEFFGIIPDRIDGLDRKAKVVIPGKLIRLTNGEVTGNVDASYMAPACTFQ